MEEEYIIYGTAMCQQTNTKKKKTKNRQMNCKYKRINKPLAHHSPTSRTKFETKLRTTTPIQNVVSGNRI